MSTDNPKISLYVPQAIYDAFIQFKDDRGLSMSQAGIVILCEYFGLEQTIQEITKRTTVGGVTLQAFQDTQAQVSELQSQLSLLESNLPLLDELEERLSIIESRLSNPDDSSKLLSGSQDKLLLVETEFNKLSEKLTTKQLAYRLGISSTSSITNQARKPEKDFRDWSKDKDPDGIAWKSFRENNKIYYSPVGDTPSELLSKLQVWIQENPQSN